MPSATRRRRRQPLRGGSVPFLNPAAIGISGPEDIQSKLDLWGVFCHGQTTVDKKFIIVPQGTHFMFTAHSGEPAEGDDTHEPPYISYKGSKDSYYEGLYNKLFKDRGAKANNKNQYPSSLYVYEPGDLIPDYNLIFRNSLVFFFRHGVYPLPIEELSGEGKHAGSYLGRPLTLIKRALDAGLLSKKDLEELNEVDKKATEEKTVAELEKAAGIPETRAWSSTKLNKKLETECCRGPTNLLFQQSKEFQAEFKEKQYVIRLSQLLQLLPKLPAAKRRFMMMSFCRVSLQDQAADYARREQAKYPILLRTVSFSGKCSAEDPRAAFNILRLATTFCGLSKDVKRVMLKREEVRTLVRKLKMVLPRGWKKCLEDTYQGIPGEQRVELLQTFQGYLTMDDIFELAHLYPELKKLAGMAKAAAVKEGFAELAKPFKTLHDQLGLQGERLFKKAEEKKAAIRAIYQRIGELIAPLKLPGGNDFLMLHMASEGNIEDLGKSLEKDYTQDDLKGLKNSHGRFADEPDVIQDTLKDMFRIYMGHDAFLLYSLEFPKVEEAEDDSIDFDDLESEGGESNNENTANVSNNNSNNNNNSSVVSVHSVRSKRSTRRRAGRRGLNH